MSPEQAAAATELDGRSDVYSLGCVLYEMLAGQTPFTGPTLESVVHQHLTADPPPVTALRPTVPAEVRGAVARALAKTPADRFTTAAAFAEALTAPRTAPPGPGRGRGRRLGAKGALALALLTLGGFWALWVRLRGSDRAAGPAAVAVLYFDNLSRDTADAYLADGLTEATIVRLGQLERLAVKSRDAVRRYRGSPHEDPTALGRTLAVGYLASGSVQRVGTRVRVTVDLVRAAAGVQVGGQQYGRTAADLLTIEEDAARRVTRGTAGGFLPAEQAVLAARPTRVPEAYDRFLRGNYYLAERTARSVSRAIQEYEAAVRLDPGFTEALARIAYGDGLILYWGWDYPGVARDSLLARGLAATERALRQDSTSSDAWMARGFLLTYEYPHTYDGMRAAFQRAIALDPRNAEAHHQYAGMLAELGDDSAAVAACHRALAIEPDRPITLVQLADLRLSERRYVEGRRWLDSALARDPAFQFAYAFRALLGLHLGDLAAARRDGEMAVRLSPGVTVPGKRCWRCSTRRPATPGRLARASLGWAARRPRLIDRRLATIGSAPRSWPSESASERSCCSNGYDRAASSSGPICDIRSSTRCVGIRASSRSSRSPGLRVRPAALGRGVPSPFPDTTRPRHRCASRDSNAGPSAPEADALSS